MRYQTLSHVHVCAMLEIAMPYIAMLDMGSGEACRAPQSLATMTWHDPIHYIYILVCTNHASKFLHRTGWLAQAIYDPTRECLLCTHTMPICGVWFNTWPPCLLSVLMQHPSQHSYQCQKHTHTHAPTLINNLAFNDTQTLSNQFTFGTPRIPFCTPTHFPPHQQDIAHHINTIIHDMMRSIYVGVSAYIVSCPRLTNGQQSLKIAQRVRDEIWFIRLGTLTVFLYFICVLLYIYCSSTPAHVAAREHCICDLFGERDKYVGWIVGFCTF